MKVCAVILAAGQGERMKMGVNKIFIELDEPILSHTLDIFENSSCIDSIIVVANEKEIDEVRRITSDFKKVIKIVPGGATRQESSYNGVLAASGYDILLVHDGARPFVRQEVITRSIKGALHYGACVVAVPEKNTIKEGDSEAFVRKTLDRTRLWSIQTPQVFRYDLLCKAHTWAKENNIYDAVDDAVMVEKADASIKIKMITGDYSNIKITTKDDISLAKKILGETMKRNYEVRVGFGVDSHCFDTEDKELILGGQKVPDCPGLRANSDGDVVFHAIFNAVSQGLGLGSIGLYADSMCLSEGIKDSAHYLSFIASEMTKKGYRIQNVGIMIEAKKPRIEPFVERMKKRLCELFSLQKEQIGICATSGEELDAFGKGRGIKCSCIVSLVSC
ncbi:MAG: 2-C-methyl-D-erythritol 4-phosphate cytidylyltransferase [bacterium]